MSHTSELREFPAGGSFVAAAADAIHRAGDAVVDMAYFGALTEPPWQVCRDKVRSADIFVLIAGFQYGSLIPEQPAISYPEFEFEIAKEAGLPRLIFMLDEKRTEGSRRLFVDENHAGRQGRFRERLLRESGLVVAQVASPQEVETALLQSLENLRSHEEMAAASSLVAVPLEAETAHLQQAIDRLQSTDLRIRLLALERIAQVTEILARHALPLVHPDVQSAYRSLCRFILGRPIDQSKFVSGIPLGSAAPDVQAALSLISGDLGSWAAGAADLSHADVRGADLIGARLVRVNLSYARLDGALLVGAKLEDSDLSHASLVRTQLQQAELQGVNLFAASLISADLTDADLRNAYFHTADLTDATLTGADFTGAVGQPLLQSHDQLSDILTSSQSENQTAGDVVYEEWSTLESTRLDQVDGAPDDEPLLLEALTSGNTVRVVVRGEVDFYTGPTLRNFVDRVLGNKRPNLQIDLRECTFFGISPAATILLDLLNSPRVRSLQIIASQRHILRGFVISGLFPLFDWLRSN